MKRILAAAAMAAALAASAIAARADVVFGIIAPSGELQATQEWGRFGEQLAAALGEPVKVMPLGTAQLLEAYRAGKLDVMITNPVMSAIASHDGGALLASLEFKSGTQLGGVIVASAASGIRSVADLRGKRLITPPMESGGAFIGPAALAVENGISIPSDLADHKIGKNQLDLIRLVARGAFDVAFVRSGMLEKVVAGGDVDPAQIVVVNEQTVPGFPHRHSTPLYPEWYTVAAPALPADRAAAIKAALLGLPAGAVATHPTFVRFIEPLDIAPMVEALRTVRMAPFDS